VDKTTKLKWVEETIELVTQTTIPSGQGKFFKKLANHSITTKQGVGLL
jgi:hypothetical protein